MHAYIENLLESTKHDENDVYVDTSTLSLVIEKWNEAKLCYNKLFTINLSFLYDEETIHLLKREIRSYMEAP